MSSGAKAGEERKSGATLFWACVMGFLAFVAAVGKAFESLPKIFLSEHQLWITEFLPDLVVALLVAGLVPVALGHIDWRESFRQIWSQSKGRFAVLCALDAVVLVLAAFLWNPVGDFYKVRYQRSLVDWAAVRGFDLVRVRDYEAAQKELKKASSKQNSDKLSILEKDIEGRLKDAEVLVARFGQHRKDQRAPTFDEVLIAGRAVRLAPRVAGVKAAMADARKIVDEALAHYLKGIDRIRQGDAAGATEALNRSRATCRGLLHQDLLLRYAQNRDLKAYAAEERGLLDYYLKTPEEKLKSDLMQYPPVRLFRSGHS